MYKKIVSGLLAMCLVAGGAVSLSAVTGLTEGSTITASAEETLTYGDFEYEEEETISITAYKGKDSNVVIPSTINGTEVTSIGGGAFEGSKNLKSITIPSTVSYIGYNAFNSCTNLTDVTILYSEDNCTTIAGGAFENCTSLKKVTIPSSVGSIEYCVFTGCSSLTDLKLDKKNENYTVDDGVLFNKDKTELVAYLGGNKRTSYAIPSTVKSVNAYAFYECPNLTSISIPNSVTTIGESAFSGCTGLKTMVLPDTVKSIEFGIFRSCDSLTTVALPKDITSIPNSAFDECSSLTNITIPKKVTTIEDNAFSDCTSLKSITIPSGVTSIGNWAFWGCYNLKSITVPKSVTSIGDSAMGFYFYYYNDEDCTDVRVDDFKIICYAGSAAHKYAMENDFERELINHTHNYSKKSTTAATCVNDGVITKTCSCGEFIEEIIPATGKHTYKTKVVKPTTSAKGYTLKTCSGCGDEIKSNYTAKLIAMSKCKATIAKSSYAYTGKAIKPTVTVKYGSKKLTKGTDYTVSYKNNTKTGKATITIKGKGKYSGTITKTFNIVPKKATLSSVKSPKTKTLKVTWKKDSQATGYQIVYSTSSKFKSSKSVNISKNSTTSKTISKLTKGKTYYVKVRSYKTINGKKVYGAYSTVKKVKCK